MKKMHEYDLVRRMFYRENISKREISRRTGYHRSTIDKMLQYAAPPGYSFSKPRTKSKLGGFVGVIDEILKSDRAVRRKQRHTAKRIFDRLVEEYGFTGSYTIVKDYVRDKKISMKEVFLPLAKRPGTSQIDFGTADVKIAGRIEKAHLFFMSLPYSDALLVQAYPREAIESFQEGHKQAYAFFDGVPPSALYDNTSIAVKAIMKDGDRDLTDGFLRLRSHYLFKSRFCNVGRPNEKGVVERLVSYGRRNFLVPIPEVANWESLNRHLLEQCTKRLETRPRGGDKTVRELLEEERPSFQELPPGEFEACRFEDRRVSSLSLVAFQNNYYSVPVRYAFREVTVKAFVDVVKLCHKDEVIAVHRRSYKRNDYFYDPIHYLPILVRKPGGLDGAEPFTTWELPECFSTFRRILEARSGNAGKREYIQVLQLLTDYKIPELRRAIIKALECRSINFESVKMLALAGREPEFEAVRLSGDRLHRLPRIRVSQPKTLQYQDLLTGGAL